jgi:IS5 family transposase
VARPRDDRQKDLLLPVLEEIIDLGHALARLLFQHRGRVNRSTHGGCSGNSSE